MMQRYNIALLPLDAELSGYCVRFAQENFARQQDGYLLGNGAVPHVTLCQFHAEAALLPALWQKLQALNGRKRYALCFNAFYCSPGRDEHHGMSWAGFAVAPQEDLGALQTGVHDVLAAQNLTPLTGKGLSYFPHLTLARLDVLAIPALQSWPDTEFWEQPHGFGLSLGLSDENGVYQHCLHADFDSGTVRATVS